MRRVYAPRIGLTIWLACVAVVLVGVPASASLIDYRSTPDSSGLHGENPWAPVPTGEGFRVDWIISQNPDLTWHYQYSFSKQNGELLTHRTSHFIIQLSEDIEEEEIFNITGDVSGWDFDTHGPSSGNPGFPPGESIFGIKFELTGAQSVVEFDCTREPMWGDFYAKDGGNPQAFVYNTDLGVPVANPNDYNGIPVDATGATLHKVLVPDTIPEPATLILMALGSLAFAGRRR
jgi:hypothetical protein